MKKILLILVSFLSIGLFAGCSDECKHENVVIDEAVSATCTEHGLTEGSHCKSCGKVLETQEIIEPLGHEVIIDNAVAATCTEDGKTAGAHCSRCDAVIVAQDIIEHIGHFVVVDEAIAATCTEHGLTEGSHCETCGEVLVAQEIIEPLGHNIVIDDAIAATCTEDGKTVGAHCSRCDTVIIAQDIIEHIGHFVVVDEAVSATCTEHGLTEGSHCETCGEVLVAQEKIEPLGHIYVFDNPIESTCSEEGKTTGLHCSRCNEQLIEQECTSKKPHTKGKFIDLSINYIENVYNPGLFECSICHQEYYDTVTNIDINMPVLSINGDLTDISKENKKKVVASYTDANQSFELNATLKLQGATSLDYPKKNYNIQFFKDDTYNKKQKVALVESWGKQNKYTLKANWVDFSEVRNVVSGKLYGDVVHSRNISDQFNSLVNGGAIDGYPILLFQNGVYQGLYTLNTSKDDYLFGMEGDDTTREAILMVNDWSDTGMLQQHIPEGFDSTWELEYASTEDNEEIGTGWVINSFNTMMDFVNENDGQDFIDGIGQYINVPRAIDSMLYTWAIKALDNSSKNILWVTYDGTQWAPSVYDMDGTWGCHWNGDMTIDGTDAWIPYDGNSLWNKLYTNMYDDVVVRWKELREGPLSIENIDKKIVDFYNLIPGELYECERQKWGDAPSQYTNHAIQMINWAFEYFENMDAAFGVNIDDSSAYRINIDCDENAYARVYFSSDYTKDPCKTSVAYSRNSDTGYLTISDGQLNFKIVLAGGYEIDEITVSGNYKNLKGPSDTDVENVYRVTKISGNLSIKITAKLSN